MVSACQLVMAVSSTLYACYLESDKIELVELYIKLNSYEKAAKEFNEKHPNDSKKPKRNYVEKLVKKNEETLYWGFTVLITIE